MKKIVVAPDKFKGSLSANMAVEAIKVGIHSVEPSVEVVSMPLADGGEGTVEAMVNALHGEMIVASVHDPLMRPIESAYGVSADRHDAYIEMAKASGILLLHPQEYDTCLATTYGTGELIAAALEQGVKRIFLGIGGSATTDAGTGMLSALGFDFLNLDGNSLKPNGANLTNIQSCDVANCHPVIDSIELILMTDVTNPLYGSDGAAHVFSAQKGATQEQIEHLDAGLKNFAQMVLRQTGKDINVIAGSGAGGGIAAGAVFGLGAVIRPGVAVVMELLGFQEAISDADLIVTGEGKLDSQTFNGKVIKGVMNEAHNARVPVAILSGMSELNDLQVEQFGANYVDTIMHHTDNEATAMEDAATFLTMMATDMMIKMKH